MRAQVIERDGFACVMCGQLVVDPITQAPVRQFSVHHRRPRGMGGSKDPAVHSRENGLTLCGTGTTGCHGKVETNRAWAKEHGYLVSQWSNPAETPVYTNTYEWALPTDEGWVPTNAFNG